MQAYNAQLTLGWKDESLRKSSNAFKEAASSMKRALASGERYWSDALKARNANWALVPAPFPGEFTSRRSTDNLAKDICISYGLENCTCSRLYPFVPNYIPAPIDIRMASVAFLNTEDGKGPIATGDRRPTRLVVSIVQRNVGGEPRVSRSAFVPSDVEEEDEDVDTIITSLQREAVEGEIFNALVTNASDLVTAPARALERSLCVDISPTMELRFEQVRLRRSLVGSCSHPPRYTKRTSIRLPSQILIQKQT
jgi:mediator of RNA polymerase II transcription subunit 17